MKLLRRYWWPALLGLALTGFTLFVALDTFVLRDVQQTEATAVDLSAFAALSAEAAPAQETGPDDTTEELAAAEAGAEVRLTEYYEYDTRIYVADVWVDSVSQLLTAFAEDSFGRNVTAATSEIAADNGALLAINGDFYGAHESGLVIRNGVLYRDTAQKGTDVLCIYADGTMKVYAYGEKTAEELLAEGVWQAFSFGPGLLSDGAVTVSATEEVGRARASNPRTAIGMIEPGHYVFVVSDGRTDESEGLSLSELAEFLQRLGVTVAYNLDGGGSSTMVYQGEVVNNPTSSGRSIREREVSDIVYVL